MFVLERDMGLHADDLEPIGVFDTLEAAKEAAQPTYATEPLAWRDYSGNLGGFIESNFYPRFRITEVPHNGIKS